MLEIFTFLPKSVRLEEEGQNQNVFITNANTSNGLKKSLLFWKEWTG